MISELTIIVASFAYFVQCKRYQPYLCRHRNISHLGKLAFSLTISAQLIQRSVDLYDI